MCGVVCFPKPFLYQMTPSTSHVSNMAEKKKISSFEFVFLQLLVTLHIFPKRFFF